MHPERDNPEAPRDRVDGGGVSARAIEDPPAASNGHALDVPTPAAYTNGLIAAVPDDAVLTDAAPPVPVATERARRASPGVIFASLGMRDFRWLTMSTLAAGFAQWAKQLALFALVYDLTGSAVQLGAVAAFRGGIGTLIAPYGGYLSDRFPRRAVIVISTSMDVVLAATLAALALADLVQVWHVYAIALGGGLAQSINYPARSAFVYDVTTDETLPNAIAVNSMVQNVSRVLGPSGFGVMMAAWGVASALIALVGLQLFAVVATLRISRVTRQTKIASGSRPLGMMREGFAYCWADKRILGLVILSAIPSLLVYPYIPFLKTVSEEVFHQGNTGYGMLSSMAGWGSLAGLFALAYVGTARHQGRVMLGGFLVYSTLLIGFAATSHYYLALGILVVAGVFHSVAMAMNNTLLLQMAKDDMRGRVMAVTQMSHGVQPLGSLPMGFAISAWGAQWGIGVFFVAATLCFALFALVWTSVRRL